MAPTWAIPGLIVIGSHVVIIAEVLSSNDEVTSFRVQKAERISSTASTKTCFGLSMKLKLWCEIFGLATK